MEKQMSVSRESATLLTTLCGAYLVDGAHNGVAIVCQLLQRLHHLRGWHQQRSRPSI